MQEKLRARVGRGGFLYSYQWQLEFTVLQNYVSSSNSLIFQVVYNNVLDVTSKWRADVILIYLTPFESLIPVIRDKYCYTMTR